MTSARDVRLPGSRCVLCLILVACSCGPLFAGSLDDFEKSATEGAKADTTEKRKDSAVGCVGCNGLFEPALRVLWYGGAASMQRMTIPTRGDTSAIAPRQHGEVQLPIASLDLSYQDVESDVRALDGRVELGYGAVGVALRYTHYDEESPRDEMDIVQWHLLYRMSLSEYFEVDLGLGSLALHGDLGHSGSSLTLPIRIRFGDYVAVVYRPAWSNVGGTSIDDHDVGLHVIWRYVSVSVGYRWFRSGDSSLDGVFVGLSTRL
jgi:hypothetical protein